MSQPSYETLKALDKVSEALAWLNKKNPKPPKEEVKKLIETSAEALGHFNENRGEEIPTSFFEELAPESKILLIAATLKLIGEESINYLQMAEVTSSPEVAKAMRDIADKIEKGELPPDGVVGYNPATGDVVTGKSPEDVAEKIKAKHESKAKNEPKPPTPKEGDVPHFLPPSDNNWRDEMLRHRGLN